jgi:tryptophan 2,3-dioxygenase
MGAERPTTYWDYIQVENLLELQRGIADDEAQLSDDEVRFIVIHQIDELWMKLVLRELRTVRDLFRLDRVPETSLAAACSGLRRVALVFELMTDHFRLMETMRTQDYLEFRDKLSPASGFQSAQLREIEILLGLDDDERVGMGHESSYLDALRGPEGAPSPALRRVERTRADRPTVKTAVYAWLGRAPIDGSSPDSPGDDRVVGAFVDAFLERQRKAQDERMRGTLRLQALAPADEDRLRGLYRAELDGARRFLLAEDVADPVHARNVRRLRAAVLFIDSNRQLPLLSWPGEIIDGLIAAEQAMLVFRQRHARMVERVIGRRAGTGGSEGVDYLDSTALRYRIFKEIWAARTMLMRRDRMPEPDNRDYYGLRAE